jgi:hypothetical protein
VDSTSSLLAHLIPEKKLALDIKRTPRTLQKWRKNREGPTPTIIGRDVYYTPEAIKAWLVSKQQPMPRASRLKAERRETRQAR